MRADDLRISARRRNVRAAIVLLFVGFFMSSAISPSPASAEPVVELLTMGPGDSLFSRFGHTALRVVDREIGRDDVYNYGVGPFHEPDFIWGFLRGQSYFYLAVAPYFLTVFDYEGEDRTLQRQRLNLTRSQVYEVIRFLEWNALPENREYHYKHLLDNCSTRIRDLLDDVTDGAIRRAVAGWPALRPYRMYTLAAGAGSFGNLLGLDMASGPNQAEIVDGWGQLYLPVYLQQAVAEARIDPGGEAFLAGPIETVYLRRGPNPIHGSPFAARRVVVAVGLGLGLWLFLVGLWARSRPGILRLSFCRFSARCLRVVGALASGRHGGHPGHPRDRASGTLASRPEASAPSEAQIPLEPEKIDTLLLPGILSRISGLWLITVGLTFGVLGVVYLVLGVVSRVPDTHWNENVWLFWFLDLWWVGTGFRALVLGRKWIGRPTRVLLDAKLSVLGGYTLLKLVGVFPQSNWTFLLLVALVTLGFRLGWEQKSG